MSIDTSTDAVEARCQHLDHVAHDRKSADAALMRALAAERDAAHAAGFAAAREMAIVDLAINGHIPAAKSDKEVSHNVGVDTAIARLRSLSPQQKESSDE